MISAVTERTGRSALRAGDVVKSPRTGNIYLVLKTNSASQILLATLYVSDPGAREGTVGEVVYYPKSKLFERFNGTLEVTNE